jgi:uncharacterized membrane protein
MASSMLVIATFAVSSMIAAYASASGTATPRSFPLIVADDVSQMALSAFIGAFIFSIVALVALMNGFFEAGGQFVLFVMTIAVFAWVVLTFVRWVDTIARLGRIGNTIDKVEIAVSAALARRRCLPNLGGVALNPRLAPGRPVYNDTIGYVQHVNIQALQNYAEENACRITVAALPGTFLSPGRAMACLTPDGADAINAGHSEVVDAFLVGNDRVFDDDPRFGLVVLSEIASRALSPAVNDPGTTIDIIGTFVRLFAAWCEPLQEHELVAQKCDRIHVPEIGISDMFDDAFTAMGRDGAGCVEVGVRLQKAFAALAHLNTAGIADAARRQSRRALAHAKGALSVADDVDAIRIEADKAGLVSD